MKRVTISGEHQVKFLEVPLPEPRDEWVLVKVHASALCTEYKAYVAGIDIPVMGHEGVGEVAAVASSGPVKVGDRVVILPQYACGRCSYCMAGDYIYCQNEYNFEEIWGSRDGMGTFAHYILKPAWLLPSIPDDVPYEKATMAIDGIGASFGAFQAIDIGAQDTVLITGLGPVGLGAVVNGRFRNARIIGVEPSLWRRNRALQMGVEAVFDPSEENLLEKILEANGGKGVDCAVDCSGKIQAQRLCIDAVRRRGRVAFVGETREELVLRVSPDLIRKGLTIVGSWLHNLADFPKVMRVIQQSPLMDLLVSHVMPMSQIQEAFELLARGESAKVVINPWK